MEKVNLTKETIDDLATEICKRFLQAGEKLLKEGEEAGLLGLLLKDYLDQVRERQVKEEKEKKRAERLKRINDIPLVKPHNPYEPSDEQNRSVISVDALNRSHQINKGRV